MRAEHSLVITTDETDHARRSLRYALVFSVRDLIQRGLHVGQGPEDRPPRFVLILQAIRSLRMMRAVEGGVTLIEPLALHGFLQRSHHEVGFLHEFVDQMGPFPWFHAGTPFRLLVMAATLRTQPALPFRLSSRGDVAPRAQEGIKGQWARSMEE